MFIGIKMVTFMPRAKPYMGKWMGNGKNIIKMVNYRLIPLPKWGNVFGKKFGRLMEKFVLSLRSQMGKGNLLNMMKTGIGLEKEFLKKESKLNYHLRKGKVRVISTPSLK